MQCKRRWIAVAGFALAAATHGASALEGAPRPQAPQSPTGADAIRPHDFGTGKVWYTAVDAWAARPWSPGFQYAYSGTSGGLFCSGGSDSRAIAQVQFPHGVTLDVMRVWLYDARTAEAATVTLESACLPDYAAAQPTRTTLASVTSGAAFQGGEFSDYALVQLGTVSDNQSCTYRMTIQLATDIAGCGGGGVGFYKARVGWLRRIPPPPAVASFGDVPPTDGFFQVVEALNASGITQGCGGGNFCPTAPVTRAAMAAFLARALGLAPDTIADPANP